MWKSRSHPFRIICLTVCTKPTHSNTQNCNFVHCFVCGTCRPTLREGYTGSPRTDYLCLFQTRFKKSHHKSKALENK